MKTNSVRDTKGNLPKEKEDAFRQGSSWMRALVVLLVYHGRLLCGKLCKLHRLTPIPMVNKGSAARCGKLNQGFIH
jgi:hypothetical protein